MTNYCLTFFIFLTFFLFIFGRIKSSEICGKQNVAPKYDSTKDPKLTRKILNSELNFQISNGLEANPHSWPWQISLLRLSGRSWVHCCGGTLISTRLVLTAAHCMVYSLDPKNYKVLLGAHDKSTVEPYTFLMDVSNISISAGNDWNKKMWKFDFAIITLSEEVRYTKEILPVCMPFDTEFKPGNYCYVTGWGKTMDSQKRTNDVLMQAGLFLQENCTFKGFEPQKMICAGDGNKDTCTGDSGGPLVCQDHDDRWYLFGITSQGLDSKCGRNRPGIYTKVNFYKTMIINALEATQ